MYYGTPPIVTNGLVLYLDAANSKSYVSGSTTWSDMSGNSNTGTLISGSGYSNQNGGSIVFDGVDDYVFKNSPINTGQNFSVFAWIRPGSINIRNAIVGNSYSYSSTVGWYFATATAYAGTLNTFFLSVGGDNAYRTATNSSITLNTWNFIGGVVTNGGADIRLYANGIETGYSGGVLSANTVTYSVNEFNIGRRYSANTEPFIGRIAQTQIYNRALTQAEITQNYNATKTRFNLT
jgi:hypothetical protein